jgi:prepilin-type processing-associated H-X9-DG protein
MRVAYVGNREDIRRRLAGSPASDNTSGAGFGEPPPGGATIAYCDGAVRCVGNDEEMESMIVKVSVGNGSSPNR